jgi:hypothetical protein
MHRIYDQSVTKKHIIFRFVKGIQFLMEIHFFIPMKYVKSKLPYNKKKDTNGQQ